MLRFLLSMLVGYFTFILGFIALSSLILFFWPAYNEAVQLFFETDQYNFSTPILICFLVQWSISGYLGGLLVMFISKRQSHVWYLAGILSAYLVYNHFFVFWNILPSWYNVIIVIQTIPFIILGGMSVKLFKKE